MNEFIKRNLWTICFALLFVALMQPAGPFIKSLWDSRAPVVHMTGVIETRTQDYVVIHVTGSKLRLCRFVSIMAFTEANGRLVDSFIMRVDKKYDGSTKPIGTYDLGLWRVYPIQGATKALIYVQHDCSGEVVMSKIAEVTL